VQQPSPRTCACLSWALLIPDLHRTDCAAGCGADDAPTHPPHPRCTPTQRLQVRQHNAEADSLRAALTAAKPEDAPSRAAVQKMQSELKQKDGRLRQLRAAIKALEAKLAELLQDKTDW
jgi:hypothetical protein